MENKLAEAINTVRGALQEIERREKASDAHLEARKKVVDELEVTITALKTEQAALEKSVADARKKTADKLNALKAAAEGVLKGI